MNLDIAQLLNSPPKAMCEKCSIERAPFPTISPTSGKVRDFRPENRHLTRDAARFHPPM